MKQKRFVQEIADTLRDEVKSKFDMPIVHKSWEEIANSVEYIIYGLFIEWAQYFNRPYNKWSIIIELESHERIAVQVPDFIRKKYEHLKLYDNVCIGCRPIENFDLSNPKYEVQLATLT